MNKENTITEIQKFLEGSNKDLKYLVNIEANRDTNTATCFIHEPNLPPRIEMHKYTPFLYIKNFKKEGYSFYNGDTRLLKDKMVGYLIDIKKMKTGNHPRLKNGFLYKVTSRGSYNNILNFFKDGGIYPYEKLKKNGNIIKDDKGRPVYIYRKLFFQPRIEEQFLISTGSRLYKGIEEYEQVHKLIFDIETTGLRFQHSRIFAIGLKDNLGYEKILEVEKQDDDVAEKKLIINFFKEVIKINAAIIGGYNSEEFDFKFIMGRAKKLELKMESIRTTLNSEKTIQRYNARVKIGQTSDKYERTNIWGYSVIDIIHAAKKTAAINSDIKNTKLKYICKFEGIAKKNRTYIDGVDGNIGKYWHNNNMFIINPENNNYLEIPDKYNKIANRLLLLQIKKNKLSTEEHTHYKGVFLKEEPEFVSWLRTNGKEYGTYEFINGKKLLKQYLLDDLWETEQVDNLYNQSSFLLAKIVPTTYARICTMGTASIWNLLLTTWSYENDLAIPHPETKVGFSGGLTRCYKLGYTKDLNKIDFAGLYPMIQLSENVFPLFDYMNVMKKILTYTTTTRNIYKKLANANDLNNEEQELLLNTGHEDMYNKILSGKEFTEAERNIFKVKQLPIKILNNALFGSLGSGYAFNWSDNLCAARITCIGRIHLRHAINWFKSYGCEPLLAVTDGINFQVPEHIDITNLINKFNNDEMLSDLMSVDNDGKFKSCLNLKRINYSVLYTKKDKKTGKEIDVVKNTGNTIKSKVMSGYIEEFIDNGMKLILNGKGDEFVDYYISYAEDIFYKQISLKKIANRKKIKNTISDYNNRGNDKNGKRKARQAHMELLIKERDETAIALFEKHFNQLDEIDKKNKKTEDFTLDQKYKLISDYMPPEEALDSMVYYVNIGNRKSYGDVVSTKTDDGDDDVNMNVVLIKKKDLENNPNLKGDYNVDKYLSSFNSRIKPMFDGFDPDVRKDIFIKIKNKKVEDKTGNKENKKELIVNRFTKEDLILKSFDHDDYDLSMHLETMEVEFWNKSGYDPYGIWDGFKIYTGANIDKYSNVPLKPEIYKFKLDYISNEMKKKGEPAIKSVNDKILKGDYLLTKNGNKYNVAYNNGKYIEIIEEDINIPKSPIEIKEEQEEIKRKNIIKKLKLDDTINTINEDIKNIEDTNLLFEEFKKEMGAPNDLTKEKLFDVVPKAKNRFEEFILLRKNSNGEEEILFGADDGDDD